MAFDTLSDDALLREKQILHPGGPVPVSRSTWWAGVRSGRFPQPIRLGPRTTAWRVGDIRALLREGVR
ncbi:helix-turn-helix transcriptional regulator [Pseudooceanicola nanhaiensis]|uniref:helix-turn-helix transcriptional regulator n=1 Tax=Pseudooceanicola nanhaiensis TaxID=375761 RepID=UPI001CD4A2DE|nr:AlpA family phage regulatory protein [Pseudooceanicola nanhaiensis]MCA0919239.1 AlpA family phage regulatory protein [Pseudooceanicola nanhaiensis]